MHGIKPGDEQRRNQKVLPKVPERSKTMKKPTYAGKITNKGSQTVEAIFKPENGKKGIVKKGDDLRVKGGKR